MQILCLDEKLFDIDDVYNFQNDRIWTPSRSEANRNGGVILRRKFSHKVMVWPGACSKGITPLLIFEEDTLNYHRYRKELLPEVRKQGLR